MKKKYISPEFDIFYDVAEPMLAGTSQHDILTKDNNDLNGGGTFGGNTPGIDLGPEGGYDPGEGGVGSGDLESKHGGWGNWGIWGRGGFEEE